MEQGYSSSVYSNQSTTSDPFPLDALIQNIEDTTKEQIKCTIIALEGEKKILTQELSSARKRYWTLYRIMCKTRERAECLTIIYRNLELFIHKDEASWIDSCANSNVL